MFMLLKNECLIKNITRLIGLFRKRYDYNRCFKQLKYAKHIGRDF